MIINKTTGEWIIEYSILCDNILKKAKGAILKRKLNNAYIFPLKKPCIMNAGIHMYFVFTSLAVIWLNEEKVVIDKVLARPFNAYVPENPAKWVIELPPEKYEKINIGDYLDF